MERYAIVPRTQVQIQIPVCGNHKSIVGLTTIYGVLANVLLAYLLSILHYLKLREWKAFNQRKTPVRSVTVMT